MGLTDKLWEFQGNLNRGKIDWKFLYSHKHDREERDQGFQMLIERGFVVAIPSQEGLPIGSGRWVVKGNERVINPEREGRTLYFTSEIYAAGYEDYLSTQEPKRYKKVEIEQL